MDLRRLSGTSCGEPLGYDVIDRELYLTPAPNISYQEILGKLYLEIAGFLLTSSLGRIFYAP